MRRRQKTTVIGSIVLACFCIGIFIWWKHSQTVSRCRGCNVIIFAIDTVGADHLPCYGYGRDTAPNLCAYAKDHTLFRYAYANGSWTLPSDVSMFTSWHPKYHGMSQYAKNPPRLPDRMPFLPEILEHAGYTTIFGVPSKDLAFPVSDVYFSAVPADSVYAKGITRVIPVGSGPKEHLEDALDAFSESVSSGHKTFLYLHSYRAHGPYTTDTAQHKFTTAHYPEIPLSWDEVYDQFSEDFYHYLLKRLSAVVGTQRSPVSREFYRSLQNAPSLERAKELVESRQQQLDSYYAEYYYFSRIDVSDPRQVEYIKALYDQKIFELDTWIGDVFLPFVNDPKIRDSTVVLVISEHGEEFFEHGRLTHETLYDSNIHIPFILSVPGISARTVTDSVQDVDVTPTILDVLGIYGSYRFQGTSLVNAILGGRILDRLIFTYGSNTENNIKAVRQGRWKVFLKNYQGANIPYAIYDTQADPSENTNVMRTHIDMATRLRDLCTAYETQWDQVIRNTTVEE